MLNVKFIMSDYRVCGFMRGDCMARAVHKNYPNVQVDCKMEMLMSDMDRANVMVFQRQFTDSMLYKARLAQQRGIKIIYDIDDLLFEIPDSLPAIKKFFGSEENQKNMTEFLAMADAVVCSTVTLATHLKRFVNRDYLVIGNDMIFDQWTEAYDAKRLETPSSTTTIGWMASASHVADAPEVGEALCKIMDERPEVQLKIIGWPDSQSFDAAGLDRHKDRIVKMPWLDIGQLPKEMSTFDIGIAPLTESSFNESKSAIKWMQHSSLSIPTVCTNSPAYECIENGKDGMKVDYGDTEGWYGCLKLLVTNAVARRGMGDIAQARVHRDYDMRFSAERWTDLFNTIAR